MARPLRIDRPKSVRTQFVELFENQNLVGTDSLIYVGNFPVPLIFRDQAVVFGGREWSGMMMPYFGRRQNRDGGRNLAGVSSTTKGHGTKKPPVHYRRGHGALFVPCGKVGIEGAHVHIPCGTFQFGAWYDFLPK